MGKRVIKREMEQTCQVCHGAGHGAGAELLRPCAPCFGTGRARLRCPRCWTWKPPTEFMGRKGSLVKRCSACTSKYANRDAKSLAEREKATTPRAAIRSDGPLRVMFALRSGNRKTGPIPVSMTSAGTCPTTCAWYGRGCYAEQHLVAIHWRRVSSGKGLAWADFCEQVAALPEGQIWRHNEAGDLPGNDGRIDIDALAALLKANLGKKGFTYTHKPLTLANVALIRWANASGFVVNLSADSLADADRLAATDAGPVTVVLPHNAPTKGLRTPEGRHVVVCPAEYREGVTCESCKLCAVSKRKSIVGFRAHGDRRKQITERLRQLPLL